MEKMNKIDLISKSNIEFNGDTKDIPDPDRININVLVNYMNTLFQDSDCIYPSKITVDSSVKSNYYYTIIGKYENKGVISLTDLLLFKQFSLVYINNVYTIAEDDKTHLAIKSVTITEVYYKKRIGQPSFSNTIAPELSDGLNTEDKKRIDSVTKTVIHWFSDTIENNNNAKISVDASPNNSYYSIIYRYKISKTVDIDDLLKIYKDHAGCVKDVLVIAEGKNDQSIMVQIYKSIVTTGVSQRIIYSSFIDEDNLNNNIKKRKK